ncbi:hypothetical protein [Gymnodinialimonas sp.]
MRSEAVLTYTHPDIRVTNGASFDLLMRDQLGSVFAVMNEAGALIEERTYAPFGEITSQTGAVLCEETFGYSPRGELQVLCDQRSG